MEASNRREHLIHYRLSNIPVHLHKGKSRKDTLVDTSGEKLLEILERIVKVIEVERSGSSWKMYLLHGRRRS